MKPASFVELRKLDVSKHIEKKNGLSYLSWAFAVDQLLQHDPAATWEYPPPLYFGETVMVFCTVKAFGKSMTAQLPVMNHKNQAIPSPDSFQVNVAMQRVLAKSIALFGIGLYIYQGEDVPDGAEEEAAARYLAEAIDAVKQADSLAAVKAVMASYWKTLSEEDQSAFKREYDSAKKKLEKKES